MIAKLFDFLFQVILLLYHLIDWKFQKKFVCTFDKIKAVCLFFGLSFYENIELLRYKLEQCFVIFIVILIRLFLNKWADLLLDLMR